MAKTGPMNTAYKDCVVTPPSPASGSGASFGTPFKNAKEPTDDKFGGGVQFDKAGSDSSKSTN